ncbi:MAG: DNA gyrase inhibitor YacG [Rhodoferax sp.]|nr:DNA gyrase inhibitor YacG [Rhodoferax sp.]
MPDQNQTRQTRLVPCPTCKGDSVYAESNPFRPFCSARCKNADFGAWASEGFSMPADPEPDEPVPGTTHLQ